MEQQPHLQQAIINGTTRAWGGSATANTYFVNLSSTAGGE